MKKTLKIMVSLSFMAMGLVACKNNDDLSVFVDEVKKRPFGQIEPLPSVKKYENYNYSSSTLRSPFQALTADLNTVKTGPGAGRKKEVLEAYPLDSLRLVGALQKKGHFWALIVDKDGLVHRLTIGNYLGQHNGKITKISEEKLELTESIVDALGRWEQRSTTINLLQ